MIEWLQKNKNSDNKRLNSIFNTSNRTTNKIIMTEKIKSAVTCLVYEVHYSQVRPEYAIEKILEAFEESDNSENT